MLRRDLVTSLRFVLGTMVLCAVVYPLLLLGFGRAFVPARAQGSLVRGPDGTIVGSMLIAQRFERPEYLWPRPSAASYDAAAAMGSNLGPSNPELTRRAAAEVARLGAGPATGGALPAELATASGSGLDPHLTLAGALYQVSRIATARGVAPARVEEAIRSSASAGSSSCPSLVNVLEANLALDRHLGKENRGDP